MVAQSYIPSRDGAICNLLLKLKKVNGSPTDNIICSIYSDSGGYPGTELDVADNMVSSSILTTTFASFNFAFTGGYSLVSTTTYWIVLSRSSAGGTDQQISVNCSTDSSYASGFVAYYGTGWNAVASNYDLYFKEYSIV
jgi:hypothetical protein